jgi:CubicO group peptidase (beta-lactamase class C family)
MLHIKRDFYILNFYIYNYCFSFFIILLACTIYSCNGQQKTKESLINADSKLIQLPAPSPVSEAEKLVYAAGCKAWYDAVLVRTGFNGGIIVAKKGNIIFEAYRGNAHVGGNDAITDSTPIHIASVSKTFTAMAVLKLWQDGKLNIDEEFVKYFPTFNYPGVTIRTLLSHRSGLPNYVHFINKKSGWDETKFVTNQDVYDFLVNKKAQLTDISRPNTHFTYCNTNYALLALLIEKITAEKYSQFINKTFFVPLGMKHSFVFDTSMVATVTPSYEWNGRLNVFNYLDAVYGDKNIYTTPRDLLIWDRALSSKEIFTDSTLQAAYSPYSNERSGVRNYGLGWRMNIYPTGEKVIYHNGWWHGNNASFVRLLDDSATIIVIGNKFNRGIYHAKEMASVFGNYGDSEDEDESISQVAPAITPLTKVKSIQPKKIIKKKRRVKAVVKKKNKRSAIK